MRCYKMKNKEKNFISAIVYLHNDGEKVVPFFKNLNDTLAEHFDKYELIAVDDACTDQSIAELKKWAKDLDKPLTILHMSLYQRRESAMNAGLDCSIGDYVIEFEKVISNLDFSLVFVAYQKTQEGNDIVSVCPNKVQGSSKLFYKLFNSTSNSAYDLSTDIFRIVTRRGINRVHALSEYLPYRKAAYASSGLKTYSLYFDGSYRDDNNGRLSLAINSLALYTNAGYKVSIGITLAMLLIALCEIVYTIVIYCVGKPIEGWTTTMFVLTFGFFGLFLILTIVIKYLSLLLDMNFKKQKYLIEGVEKIQK